jgi:hypothetical protein
MTSGSRCVGRLAPLSSALSSPRLQTLSIKELRVQFSNEDEALNAAIKSAKKTIETLKKKVAKCTESSTGGKKQLEAKIEFLDAHIQPITTSRELLNVSAQVTKCVTS